MCSLCRLLLAKKPQFWANFDFWGLLYRSPFGGEGQIWCAVRSCAKFRLDRFIPSLSVDEKPQFCRFFVLRHVALSPIGNSLTKLNTGVQLQTFPYPTASKSFLYSNVFMLKSGAQPLTFKSVTNKEIDKQTKNSTFLAAMAAGEIPTKLARY